VVVAPTEGPRIAVRPGTAAHLLRTEGERLSDLSTLWEHVFPALLPRDCWWRKAEFARRVGPLLRVTQKKYDGLIRALRPFATAWLPK
jgi:hypothetical protein